jgi:hypothetical protein
MQQKVSEYGSRASQCRAKSFSPARGMDELNRVELGSTRSQPYLRWTRRAPVAGTSSGPSQHVTIFLKDTLVLRKSDTMLRGTRTCHCKRSSLSRTQVRGRQSRGREAGAAGWLGGEVRGVAREGSRSPAPGRRATVLPPRSRSWPWSWARKGRKWMSWSRISGWSATASCSGKGSSRRFITPRPS